MSTGKYSPTVFSAYADDQDWWEKNGGGFGNGVDPDSECDDDGYDSYGYSGRFGDGPDREGYTELNYLNDGIDGGALVEDVAIFWGFDGTRPVRR